MVENSLPHENFNSINSLLEPSIVGPVFVGDSVQPILSSLFISFPSHSEMLVFMLENGLSYTDCDAYVNRSRIHEGLCV